MGRRGRRYFAPDGGRDGGGGWWSEPRSSPTAYAVPLDQALLSAVMQGVLRSPVPLLTHVAVPALRMLALLLLLLLLRLQRQRSTRG